MDKPAREPLQSQAEFRIEFPEKLSETSRLVLERVRELVQAGDLKEVGSGVFRGTVVAVGSMIENGEEVCMEYEFPSGRCLALCRDEDYVFNVKS
ncbi:MAG TPA: hypothetical protein VEJ46_04485 [Candidatus Acidoferrum sp.]|nr:hypothetical protein [Candidatus Acidoferrum sp.]